MTTVAPVEVSAAIAAGASLGDFFAVTTGARTGHWLPFSALLDAEVQRSRIGSARSMLATMAQVDEATIDWRVAASTVSLGVFARLMAPPFGALIATGVLPHLTPESLWWQPVLGGPVPLALDEIHGLRGGAVDYARVVLEGLVVPVVAAFRREGVSPVVLLGNVSSALGGAATMVGNARPDLAEAAWGLVSELLKIPMLLGTATLGPSGLRRNSCCLFYRVPGGGFCGDCVLADRGALSR